MEKNSTVNQDIELSHTNISIDTKSLWECFPTSKLIDLFEENPNSLLALLYRAKFLPLALRHRVWRVLNKSYLDTNWLEQLNNYWTQVLGGRPIVGVLDFAYLHGIWREKFYKYSQSVSCADDIHLVAWQQPELLFQLLSLVYRESRDAGTYKASMMKYAPSTGSILEFGAAISPVTRSIINFGLSKRPIYVADLPTYAFHYACFSFRNNKNINPIVLIAENNFELPGAIEYGAIFCLEVFEHLPDPLSTVVMLHDRLIQNGILVFDYIKSDATGLDTINGLEDRIKVLSFIENNFKLIKCDLSDTNKSIGISVVRKK